MSKLGSISPSIVGDSVLQQFHFRDIWNLTICHNSHCQDIWSKRIYSCMQVQNILHIVSILFKASKLGIWMTNRSVNYAGIIDIKFISSQVTYEVDKFAINGLKIFYIVLIVFLNWFLYRTSFFCIELGRIKWLK